MNSFPTLERKWDQQNRTTENPTVSVIMIFFNAETFLREAIKSVFFQTYERWELLLVDDGSFDESTAIALEYSREYPEKVRYLEHPEHQNQGKPASRNLGIQNASGDYIAFLDADDVWLPQKLEQQVGILEAHPEAAMLYGLSQWWYSWTGNHEDRHRDYVHQLGVVPDRVIKPPQLLLSFFLRQDSAIPCPTNILIRKNIFEEIGGFEQVFTGPHNTYEDQAFYAKVCLRYPIIAMNQCWDRYRQHPNSSCSIVEKAGQEIEVRLFFLNWLRQYLSDQNEKNLLIQRELTKEIWRTRHPRLRLTERWLYQAIKRIKMLPFHAARWILPAPIYAWLKARWFGQEYIPPVGWIRFGNLRRLAPLSRQFGYDRGTPVDRYYIENFLSAHQEDIKGRVLEIAEDNYTRQFGGDQVIKSDVLHVTPDNPNATIVGDITSADHIPSETFDCVVLTQTLQVIFDVPAALRTVYRILRPSGVVLVTIPGISPISRHDYERWGYFWSFTTQSARRLFEEFFPKNCVQVQAYGNVLTAAAFLYGLAEQELRREELAHCDPDYELIITVRAEKPARTR